MIDHPDFLLNFQFAATLLLPMHLLHVLLYLSLFLHVQNLQGQS